MKERAVILLSGGLDSIANLYAAAQDPSNQVALAITLNYGQRAAATEAKVAKWHCKKLGIPHKNLKTKLFERHSTSALINTQKRLPQGKDVQIDNLSQSEQTAKAVWVPNRNGIFLNLAAFFAETLDATQVLIGFNAEEAQTFADNSKDFMLAANHFFSFSTRNQVKAFSYTVDFTKPQIIQQYGHLFDISTTWPCYQQQKSWCGQCESCLRFRRAIESAQLNWEDHAVKNQAFIRSL